MVLSSLKILLGTLAVIGVFTTTVYPSLGVFISTLRFDELFFAHSAWSVAYFGTEAVNTYTPALYVKSIAFLVGLMGPDPMTLVYLRGLNIILASVLTFGFSLLIIRSHHLKGILSRAWATSIAFALLCYISAVRGFELRPESFGNLFLLLSASYCFCSDRIRLPGSHYAFCVAAISFGIFASLGSVRYLIPSLLLAIASLMIFSNRVTEAGSLLKVLGTVLAIVLLIHLLVLPIDKTIESLLLVEDSRISLPLEYKFFKLGLNKAGGAHWFYSYYRMGMAAALLLISLFVLIRLLIVRAERTTILTMTSFLLLLPAFYALLYFEKAPFNYVVSMEITIFVITMCYAAKLAPKTLRLSTLVIFTVCLIPITSQSIEWLESARDTQTALERLSFDLTNKKQYLELDNEGFGTEMSNPSSILSQVYSMKSICKIYANTEVVVSNHNIIPVCLPGASSQLIAQSKTTYENVLAGIRSEGRLLAEFETRLGSIAYYKPH
jgi:hypothetical protein